MRTALSVVIPFYDEEENVERVLSEMGAAFAGANIPYEFICVNNGSRDATGTILERLSSTNKQLTIVTIPTNEGYGWGVSNGIKAANFSLVTVVSGDGQVDPHDIIRAYTAIERTDADIVKPRRITRHDGWWRRFLSFVYNLIMKILFGLPGWDFNAPPKVMKRKFLQRISIESKTSFIDPEILIKAKRLGAVITEVPATYRARMRGSGYTRFGTIWQFIVEIVYWRLLR